MTQFCPYYVVSQTKMENIDPLLPGVKEDEIAQTKTRTHDFYF